MVIKKPIIAAEDGRTKRIFLNRTPHKKRFLATAPVVSDLDNPNSPNSQRTRITLSGLSFRVGDETPTAAIETSLFITTSWLTMTTVLCQTQEYSFGTGLRSVLTIASVVGSISAVFTFDGEPNADRLQPVRVIIG